MTDKLRGDAPHEVWHCQLHYPQWCSCPQPKEPSHSEILRLSQKLVDAVEADYWKAAIVQWPERFLHTKDCNVHSPTLRPCSCLLETRLKAEILRLERSAFAASASVPHSETAALRPTPPSSEPVAWRWRWKAEGMPWSYNSEPMTDPSAECVALYASTQSSSERAVALRMNRWQRRAIELCDRWSAPDARALIEEFAKNEAPQNDTQREQCSDERGTRAEGIACHAAWLDYAAKDFGRNGKPGLAERLKEIADFLRSESVKPDTAKVPEGKP